MTIQGTVERVMETETFPSGFQKRVLVINTGGEWHQTIPVEFVKDKTSKLDGLQPGQNVTAHINLRGNEYNGKYYANVQGWRLESESAPQPAPAQPVAAQNDDEDGGIPF